MTRSHTLRRALALGIILMLAVAALPGCVRQSSVSLRIISARSGTGISGATLTFSGADGTNTLTADKSGAVSGKVASDRTQVTAEAAGYQKASLSVSDFSQLPATVKLTPLFLAKGVVTSGGQPIAGASVTIWNTTVTTGSDGSFSFEGLAAGSYTGRVTKQGFADATFEATVGASTAPVRVVLQEGQLLPLTSPATLSAYELTASYQRTLKGEDKSFSGRIVKNGADTLVMTGDPADPTASLMVRSGTGYVFENGAYAVKGETAAAAAQVLQGACQDLLLLPATFSARSFTSQKQTAVTLLGQECSVYRLSGNFTFEREPVSATATVTVGTSGALANVPVKIVLHAANTTFFDFTYDATVEIVSTDQAAAAARFPAQ